jgi:hypothetical protein
MQFAYRNAAGVVFERALSVTLCEYPKCTKLVTVGAPYCAVHLQHVLGLRIGTSTIPDAGMGVFACEFCADDRVVIPEGDVVCPYVGEVLNLVELDARYGDTTAPYALRISDDVVIDAACHRGVGAMINHSAEHPNTEFVINADVLDVDIVATRDILAGEELFVNYGAEYCFDDAQFSTHAVAGELEGCGVFS